MADFDVDLFVIGGGSGGVRAARIAAGHGARVMLAEEYRMGGTCVIRGCVPKKLLVYASRFADDFEDAKGFGWSLEKPSFNWANLIAAKDREITRLEAAYSTTLANAGVKAIKSRAVIEDAHTVRLLSSDTKIRARHILIATGATPSLDPIIPGAEFAITSNEAFHLKELPEHILIVGGGYIAVEFAGIFAGLGSQTTLLHRGDKLLRGFDADLRDGLADAYQKRGIHLKFGTTLEKIEQIEKHDKWLGASFSDGTRAVFDQILIATGRKPNTQNLGLEKAGVRTLSNGAIAVDVASTTNIASIHAVGDVTDRANLTPIAIREGHAFADRIFGPGATPLDYSLIPTAVFSTPEIGTVGLSEEQARAQYADVTLYKTSFRPMLATLAGRDQRMLMKLVVETLSNRILGVHVLGHDAGEIIQMAGIALTMGATKADFDRTIAVHPSAAEELVTMRSAWTPPPV